MAKSEEKKKEPEKKGASEKKPGAQTAKKESGIATLLIILVPIIVLFLVFYFVVLPSSLVTVPFTTFKSNYDSAHQVAIFVTYSNESQFVNEANCAIAVTEALGKNPNNVTIYYSNSTNCVYKTGPYTNISVANGTRTFCISAVKSVPTIFLNYSYINSTVSTAYNLYVYGNDNYWGPNCPLEVDMH